MILRWLQRAFFFGGLALFAYCGFIVVDAWLFQERESRTLDEAIESTRRVEVPSTPPEALPVAAGSGSSRAGPPDARPQQPLIAATVASPRDLIGRIEIPRLGLSAIVMQGTDAFTLRRAIGHLQGTAMPGQSGNSVLTAHRDTFFRPLRNIQKDDGIRVATPLGQFSYHVVSISVVEPSNTTVVGRTANETLTLITCFPFSYIGPAPRRLVVRAARTIPGQ